MKLFKRQQNAFSNKAIAHILRSVAAVYQLKNELFFKIVAYQRAADVVEKLTRELKDIWQDGALTNIDGIGPSIASHLDEYFRTGTSKHFKKILSKVPATVFELMKVPSIGPKKAYKLVQNLNLKNSDMVFQDLEEACLEGRVAKIPSFGERSQKEILEALALYHKRVSHTERMPLPYAFSLVEEIVSYLKKHLRVKRVDPLGSLRRMVATIGDIDISAQVENTFANEVVAYFVQYPKKISIDNAGEKKASIIVSPGIRVDLRIQDKKRYGSMLQYLTGSKSHNIKLREHALKKGFSLSEYGLTAVNKKEKKLAFQREEDLYSFLGLQYIPPEIREGTDELERAKNNNIPQLVEARDIKGDMHIHSSYDLQTSHDVGAASYQEIMNYGMHLGYEYVGFSDHNPKVTGIKNTEIVAIVKKRKEYIDKLFPTKKFERSKYFIGLEVDILSDGKIALPQEAIKYVDYIIISIHSSFTMNIKTMTKRVLEALKYDKVRILGHPTGRLINKREGIEVAWEKVFEVCKNNRIALEINSYPERLDLPDMIVHQAVEAGVSLIINTDAHANSHMDNMAYGVSVARRGWCKKHDIINTKQYSDFKKWLIQ